jgi:dTDP-4-amino-4,6-dideoxygalactose transaminase
VENKYNYNSWPLGKLPTAWQRSEPETIKKLGYKWNDPRDIIDIFENKLARFAGAKYCVLTDSATSGLFLAIQFRNTQSSISIPVQTYVSVAMQIIASGSKLEFREEKWSGLYELGGTNIFDSAARFSPKSYVGSDALQILSFQIKKRLPIGKGGAILTDSKEAYEWLKYASYDGRDLTTPYNDSNHIKQFGWHCYMTPEDAARGIILMDSLPANYEDTMNWSSYPPLTDYEFFKNYKIDNDRGLEK